MAEKIITIADLKLGKLTLSITGSNLNVERRYEYLDEADEVIDILPVCRIVRSIPIASVPANIMTALQAIDVWTKAEAIAQEGMTD